MNKINFETLKKSIKSFDLILCTTNSNFSTLINFSQQLVNGRGKYTHIALCIKGSDLPNGYTFDCKVTKKTYKIESDEIYLFESVVDTKLESPNVFGDYFDGVQLRKFDETINSYFKLMNKGTFTELAYCRSKENLNLPSQYLYSIVNKYLGIKYNTGIVDKLYVPFNNFYIMELVKGIKGYTYGNDYKNNGILCTTLAAEILKDIGLYNKDVNPSKILTEDFVYNTSMAKQNKLPQIYFEPIDIEP